MPQEHQHGRKITCEKVREEFLALADLGDRSAFGENPVRSAAKPERSSEYDRVLGQSPAACSLLKLLGISILRHLTTGPRLNALYSINYGLLSSIYASKNA